MTEEKRLQEMDEKLLDYENRKLKGKLTNEEKEAERLLEQDKAEFSALFSQFKE